MSNHGLPEYRYTDFHSEVILPHVTLFGRPPYSVALRWDKYIPLYDDNLTCNIKTTAFPNLSTVMVAGGSIQVYPVTTSGAFLSTDKLIELWYGRIGRVVGATELELGPHKWQIPASIGQPSRMFTNVAWPTTVFGSWQQPPDNLTPPQATTAADPEPPCHCDSHKLATVGHDEYCAYILWKRRSGK